MIERAKPGPLGLVRRVCPLSPTLTTQKKRAELRRGVLPLSQVEPRRELKAGV